MSALDQAFIKAYAKDAPAETAAAPGARPQVKLPLALRASTATPVPAQVVQAQVIEQIYHEGTLYRVELPPPSAPRRATIPAPHFELPPRSSPRRNVRRSMLRLLGQESEAATPMPIAPPMQRSGQRTGDRRQATPVRQELAPEVIFDQPHKPPSTLPAVPSAAPFPAPLPIEAPWQLASPLDLAHQFEPQFEVHGHWDAASIATPSALVVLPAPADLHVTEPAPLIELHLAPLPEAPAQPQVAELPGTPAAPSFRVDPPHATARPHVKFTSPAIDSPIAAEIKAESPATEAYFGTHEENTAEDDTSEQDQAATGDVAVRESDVSFADADTATSAATDSPTTESQPNAAADDCVPLWEVDRFQWPVTVERLVSDKDGYFAQASGRLIAAVRDGLRTLAISGSRRGEGRTTLALCLARAAAQAGIQVAVIDADFARPQLAARIGLEVNHGWQDAATGLVPLSEAAIRSLSDNITVLPLEASAARTGLSLADPRVTATLRAAAATFELVIVDLGPLAAGDEPLFPAEEACPLDAAIVVRDLRYASSAESEEIGQRLMAAGVEAVGIAENFVVDEEIPVTSV
jgi:Mrp family chromosome partitioning ATPase